MFTAMEETPRTLKGKHGAMLEHSLFWVFFVYFFWITESTVPFYAKNTTVIQDCKFSNNHWDNIIAWYHPIIIYVGLGIIEFLGIMFNKIK